MSAKKNKISNEIASGPYQVWKEKPAGPEQKELDRMFQCNEIDASSSPDSVRLSTELFRHYPSKIFASHFRKTKAKQGLCATVFDQPGGNSSHISELGSPNSSRPFVQSSSIEEDVDETIEFKNAPFCTWIYTDHQKKRDFVCVALPIFSGSRDINFSLSEDGSKLTVHYIWPTAIYKPCELFEVNNNNDMSENHPKVHALISHLLDQGLTEKSNPRGSITITLPKRVQRETEGWSKKAVNINDTKIILLEFMAYQKAKLVDDEDTSLNFN